MALGLTSRRGVIFTLMSIVVASVLLVATSLASDRQSPADTSPELVRVEIVDRTLDSFTEYTESSIRLSVYAALDNLSRIIANDEADGGTDGDVEKKRWFDSHEDFQTAVATCIFEPPEENKVKVQDTSREQVCLEKLNLPILLGNFTKLINETFDIEIEYAFKDSSFMISEPLPFTARVNVTLAVNISDVFSNWTIDEYNYSLDISLVGVTDPLIEKFGIDGNYTKSNLNTRNFTPTTIKETEWNNFTIQLFIGNATYRNTPEAPSILGRYYANFSPSPCCGVETMLLKENLETGSTEGFPDYVNYSFVDHELLHITPSVGHEPSYFRCADPPTDLQNYGIKNAAPRYSEGNFRLNASVLERYNISGLVWEDLCS